MTSNQEFLNRYSPLSDAQHKRVSDSVRVISKSSKRVICEPPSQVKHDFGHVGSDGIRRPG